MLISWKFFSLVLREIKKVLSAQCHCSPLTVHSFHYIPFLRFHKLEINPVASYVFFVFHISSNISNRNFKRKDTGRKNFEKIDYSIKE